MTLGSAVGLRWTVHGGKSWLMSELLPWTPLRLRTLLRLLWLLNMTAEVLPRKVLLMGLIWRLMRRSLNRCHLLRGRVGPCCRRLLPANAVWRGMASAGDVRSGSRSPVMVDVLLRHCRYRHNLLGGM